MKDIPTLFNRKEECSGCAACYSVCPKNAISMIADSEGFEYPFIDGKQCICCYSCVRVCPNHENFQIR